jgi:hypothetical protein
VLTAVTKVAVGKLKIKTCCQCVQRNNSVCFDKTNEYLEVSGKAVSESVRRDMTEYFTQLQRSLEEFFPTNVIQ